MMMIMMITFNIKNLRFVISSLGCDIFRFVSIGKTLNTNCVCKIVTFSSVLFYLVDKLFDMLLAINFLHCFTLLTNFLTVFIDKFFLTTIVYLLFLLSLLGINFLTCYVLLNSYCSCWVLISWLVFVTCVIFRSLMLLLYLVIKIIVKIYPSYLVIVVFLVIFVRR